MALRKAYVAVWIFGEYSGYLWKQGFALQQLLGYKPIFFKFQPSQNLIL